MMSYSSMSYLFGAMLLSLASPAAIACNPLPDAVSKAIGEKQLILIGEMHGTQQSPQVFYDIICAALSETEQVTVGLELLPNVAMPLTDPASLAPWIATHSEWQGPHDGRTSQAMYGLLQQLLLAKQTHPQLSILLFNSVAEARDSVMADNILVAYHGQKTLIYAGDYHTKVAYSADREAMMGALIKQRYPQQIYSIKLVYDGGTAWNWQDTIGVHPLHKSQQLAPSTTLAMPAGSAYDLLWNIGVGTASLPYLVAETQK